MAEQSHAVSAPGKVLLAGGYLVLDRDFTGLVFGIDARIHVYIEPLETTSGVALEEIVVRSPQFKEAVWQYGYRVAEKSGGVEVTQLKAAAQQSLTSNPFVETTLGYVLTYITTVSSPIIKPSSISILADDSYYTQPSTEAPSQAKEAYKFTNFKVKLSDAHKTGLGSSAALVTALTAALLVHYLPEATFSIKTDAGQTRLHNLAQAAHCAAQGKVGSGFDVASAVYGSCLYRRFSPAVLQNHGEPGSSGFAKNIQELVEDKNERIRIWDTEVFKDAVKVPKGIRMVMCDVDCGSQTPGMVKQMLAWRAKESDEANMIWGQLDKRNSALAAELTKLTDTGSKDYSRLKQAITEIRVLIQEMSRLSGVPVEPLEQTKLIDACSAVDGVIGGVVPGAGGYDAIALLIEDKEEVITSLQQFLKGYKVETYKDVQSGPSMGKVSMLPVREEMEGIRTENASKYGGWVI
ncbi:hypothetical protein BLS_008743 [Venturia inaequalis]|uniref:Phosphomevalonate kinase n=1 Tax=Venturia inaequalis TaxID=5025 RepID=A0A8H3UK12_VENIN|nr:hypothetical protein BLS_008743 [Venturia inaequalis]KAE9971085.1 hypothetical protein EG328_005833 [Venturia inaequalis]KAE9987385.1 hypothetical protein EG327_003831 [Venturia inaequalis]